MSGRSPEADSPQEFWNLVYKGLDVHRKVPGDRWDVDAHVDLTGPAKNTSRRGLGQPFYLGSAKSNIRHGESASGVTSLVKVLLMMKENMIPPHCGIKTKINQNFPTDLAQRNVHIAPQPTAWNRPSSGKRRMFLNNFSAAGGKTALLLEDSPLSEPKREDTRRTHVITLSARSQTALWNNIDALCQYIIEQEKTFGVKDSYILPSLAYTTTARRIHHPFRVTAIGSSLQEVRDSLIASSQKEANALSAKSPGIGFLLVPNMQAWANSYINWKHYHQDFSSSHRVLPLPAYKWDLKNYWIPYRNNFCLTKGTPVAARVVESRDDGSSATVVVQNDIAEPDLSRVIQGHKVNGAALCPSSLYADIAQTLAEYLIEKYKPKLKGSGLDVCNCRKGDAHRLRQGMVYKLFSALVDYGKNYQSIREVILDSEHHEATALVKFQAAQANFHRNPYWIDSFGHLSGFIMNASDATDSKNQVFVNHGWDSMRCLKKFSVDATYRTYIFEGDNIIAVYGGVKFQALSLFIEHPTVGDFKRFVTQLSPSEASDSSSIGRESEYSFNGDSSSGLSSPASSGTVSPPNERVMQVHESSTMKEVRALIADEIGVLADESLEKSASQMDMDLSREFFIENQTLGQNETALDLKPMVDPTAIPQSQPITLPQTTSSKQLLTRSPSSSKSDNHTPATFSSRATHAQRKLFLFPDGSGSATYYATIPGVSPNITIRRHQPTGPYNLGGCSAGGICAYDAARKLVLQQGETVETLLLDSPFPIGLEKLPPRLYGFFNSIGLFGEGKAAPPAWLLPNFLAFIDSFDAYKAVPLPFNEQPWQEKLPKTSKPDDPLPGPAEDGSKDPREMLWLLPNRTDLDRMVGIRLWARRI
ncbi:hypothetical protein BDW66DRAFT_150376 [Aspergillus desertorum]